MRKIFLLSVIAMSVIACNQNPLLHQPATPYGVPAFDKVEVKHYMPAFEEGIKQQKAEIEAIVSNPEAPTFDNTIAALDRTGSLLASVEGVFFNLLETDGNDEMHAIAETIMPQLSELSDGIYMNEALFERVKAVYAERETLGLTPEQMRLLTETYKAFANNGANLSDEAKARLMEINKELGVLTLRFGNNLVAETAHDQFFITDENELKGLSDDIKAAAKAEAQAAGRDDAWLFTTARTSFTPVLQYCENRELRKQLLLAYASRCNRGNEYDNKAIIQRQLELRIEKAQLFGYNTPADQILEDCMAKTPQTAYDFLLSVWEPSLQAAKREAQELQKMMDADLAQSTIHNPQSTKLEPWDWWFYAEKLRQAKYALDQDEIRPYFELSNVRKGAFLLAHNLYGLNFEKLENMPIYHPEVEVFKVTDAEDNLVGIFYTDYFPRSTKMFGAWMNEIQGQFVDANGVDHRPTIINVGNFTKPTADKPSLLSLDDVETLFHEFGHALHGLMSKATYHSLSGTNTPRDFVELPSQFMENYCYRPEILKTYAFHYQTGELIPDSLVEKLQRAAQFNQGFVETELLSSSIMDMDFHMLSSAEGLDVNAFEAASMEKMGMIPEIITRYRPTNFNHIFGTSGYQAGYYSYTWSAVLDADAFAAFAETGDILNPEVAARFKRLLEQGGTIDAAENYLQFRGKEADPQYLLRKKGFIH